MDASVALEVAMIEPAVTVYPVVEVARMILAFNVPFDRARVREFRLIAVLADSDPPRENTFVEVENDTPFVAVEVENCDAVVRHIPEIEKQPLIRFRPLLNVEEAVVEVMFSVLADNPEANVEVPCPLDTVIAPAKVEVAVLVAIMLPSSACP